MGATLFLLMVGWRWLYVSFLPAFVCHASYNGYRGVYVFYSLRFGLRLVLVSSMYLLIVGIFNSAVTDHNLDKIVRIVIRQLIKKANYSSFE